MGECLDGYLITVPFETLKRAAKDRKARVDGVAALLKSLNSKLAQGRTQASDLAPLLSSLESLRSRLREVGATESRALDLLQARLLFLSKNASVEERSRGRIAAARRRLPALLGDHMLRRGLLTSAARMGEAARCEPLLDLDVFQGAPDILTALRRRDPGPALAWCSVNEARLKRLNSPLVWRLRLQEMIELVRAGDSRGSLRFARTQLAPLLGSEPAHMEDARAVAAVLALGAGPARAAAQRYEQLLDLGRWELLARFFLLELERLCARPTTGALTATLWAGLAALKAPGGHRGATDPMKLEAFAELARRVPYAKCGSSRLLCAISKKAMDDSNPPMVLPNGYVYGLQALDAMVRERGRIVCPVTGYECTHEELKMAFVS